jgi:hypothetical protein
MTINQVLEESGPQIAALLDPELDMTEPRWNCHPREELLIVSGAVKVSNCGVKVYVQKSNNDDFTALDIVVDARYDIKFHTYILTNILTTKVLLGYIQAGLRRVTADMTEYELMD